MAAANSARNKKPPPSIQVPECPVCMEDMCAPIYQCKIGHSMCSSCSSKLYPALCPVCRQEMTQTRNWQLEEFAAKAKSDGNSGQKAQNRPCPNKPAGCCFILNPAKLDDHRKDCIFRMMDCPLKLHHLNGNCSWNGLLKDVMKHCKQEHEANCLISDKSYELINADINQDKRRVYITSLVKSQFIFTMRVDTLKNMVYWVMQLIGSEKTAQQYLYEICLSSKDKSPRKVVFSEHCFGDDQQPEKVFATGKCAMLPLKALTTYVADNQLTFSFSIKKITPPAKKNEPTNTNQDRDNKKYSKKPPKGPEPVTHFCGYAVVNNN